MGGRFLVPQKKVTIVNLEVLNNPQIKRLQFESCVAGEKHSIQDDIQHCL